MRMQIIIAQFLVFALIGCSAEKSADPKVILRELVPNELVYVCGCPMMCCNSVSRRPGRCICNVALQPGTVTSIHDGKIHVSVSGREKVFIVNR